jgi:hypothetical protein
LASAFGPAQVVMAQMYRLTPVRAMLSLVCSRSSFDRLEASLKISRFLSWSRMMMRLLRISIGCVRVLIDLTDTPSVLAFLLRLRVVSPLGGAIFVVRLVEKIQMRKVQLLKEKLGIS